MVNFLSIITKFFRLFNENFKNIIVSIKQQTLNIFFETKNLIKNRKDLFIWSGLIPLIFIAIIVVFTFSILFYYFYFLKFIIKKIKIIRKKNKKEIIKINKNTIEVKKNVYLIFFKQIFWNQANMKGFLLLYYQLEIIKNIKKKKELKEVSIFLIERILFRIIFVNITGLPLIVIKNVNFIFKIIKDVFAFKKTPFKIKIKTVIYNIIIKYNINLALKSKKIKIILLKNKTILNMKDKDFDILKNLKDFELWVSASNNLINLGTFSKLRYLSNNKRMYFHPSFFFYNHKYNEIFSVNQTSGKNLEILEKLTELRDNSCIIGKKKIELELQIKKILNKGNAFMTIPHIVKEEDIILGDPTDLIKKINNPENIITKFKFIQSFFINLEFDIYRYDKENGLSRDKNYINFKDYLIKNFDNLEPEVKIEFMKLIEFFEKNKKTFQENKLNFIDLLNKADINIDIKNFFFNLITKHSK